MSEPTATPTHRLIGDIVVDLGFATREQVEEAVRLARVQGKPTGQTLVEQGVLRHDELARAVSERYEIPYIDLSLYDVDMIAAALLNLDAARSYQAVPIDFTPDGEGLLLATADPMNALTLDDIAMATGRSVQPVCASADEIHLLITRLAHARAGQQPTAAPAAEPAAEPAVASEKDLVAALLTEALRRGASEIHLSEAQAGEIHAHLRVDGALELGMALSAEHAKSAVAQLKELACINGASATRPQEGHFELTVSDHRLDVRALTLPLSDGQDVFLRVLDAARGPLALDQLGMQPTELDRFSYAISRPSGMVLVSGPAGAGLSSTLYAALAAINDGSRRILTLERQVDMSLAGVRQMQVGEDQPGGFPAALQSILRAAPDVLMVAELADPATAQLALEAAIAGRLVLAGLHARDAQSALSRLLETGVEPHLVAAGVDCVVSQRLVRVLCPHCKRRSDAAAPLAAEYGLAENYEPAGCERCAGSGYRGRTGIFEVMPVSEQMRKLILAGADAQRLLDRAAENGMRRLHDDALAKVRAGVSSITEIERLTAALL